MLEKKHLILQIYKYCHQKALLMIYIRYANWLQDMKMIKHIRRTVFVNEQRVPEEIDFDGLDGSSTHWLAFGDSNIPIGTARMQKDGHFGRMAVLKHYRNNGVGKKIFESALTYAVEKKFPKVWLHSQITAVGFYKKFGFTEVGDMFLDAWIEHMLMTKELFKLQKLRT